ncbi:major facilitator superfamily domain-containing protein [Pyrenochaeta sp. MPI-SDFR-AT-0127]|nr:major facilitator superfamily domain-containing protein [Pyrenochaeta sp. MPI-SDFR-AT-0127]
MGLGVLDAGSPGMIIPGTVVLAVDDSASLSDSSVINLKRGTGKHRDIILIPQPSDDPNDPLNWPYYQKLMIVVIIVLGGCGCAAVNGPLLNPSVFVMSLEFKRPIADITVASGYQLLLAGAMGPFVSATARKYGKRPLFIFSSLACLIGTIVGSFSTNYDTLLAARIVQGVSIAAYESLSFTLCGDIFFVHERGLYVSVMSFTMTCVSSLSSVVGGKLSNDLGWHYLFHILNVFIGFQLLLLFFFVPETCYRRNPEPTTVLQAVAEDEKDQTAMTEVYNVNDNQAPSQIPKKTFWQSLAIFTGSYTDESLIRLFLAPLISCLNLAALWTVVITGAVVSFYVGVAYVTAQLFAPPPYNLSPAGVGYMSIGPFVGGVLGCLIAGALMDPLTIWLSKRNGGVYEAEFRLPLVAVGVLCGAGLMAFGSLSEGHGNIYVICFAWGLALVGITFIIVPCSAYAIDAFRSISDEVFILNIMFKNFLFYAYSYFINNWTAASGPVPVFYTFGGISFGLVATTAIVYVFGKRYRVFWHRHNIMAKFGMEGSLAM